MNPRCRHCGHFIVKRDNIWLHVEGLRELCFTAVAEPSAA